MQGIDLASIKKIVVAKTTNPGVIVAQHTATNPGVLVAKHHNQNPGVVVAHHTATNPGVIVAQHTATNPGVVVAEHHNQNPGVMLYDNIEKNAGIKYYENVLHNPGFEKYLSLHNAEFADVQKALNADTVAQYRELFHQKNIENYIKNNEKYLSSMSLGTPYLIWVILVYIPSNTLNK